MKKKTGLIGLITGIIGFILTLVYVCFSGYIFTNDEAYGIINISGISFTSSNLVKLYPNGARYKWDTGSNKYITIDENDKGEYANKLLYKDLGKKQYNYNSDYYETYNKGTSSPCNIGSSALAASSLTSRVGSCDYLYYPPFQTIVNKYIYDRWLTALILSIVIFICDIGLSIFGFLLFKNSEELSPTSEQTPIVYKK